MSTTEERRNDLLNDVWAEQDTAYDLMAEYDSLPHHYGDNIMYQAEGQIIDLIAANPGITITDLAQQLRKTTSACSQLVRRLREKDWIEQTRNARNNRQFNLNLTPAGEAVYNDHTAFCADCQKRAFELLSRFSEEELAHHIAVQRALNEAYRGDIERSRSKFEQIKQ